MQIIPIIDRKCRTPKCLLVQSNVNNVRKCAGAFFSQTKYVI